MIRIGGNGFNISVRGATIVSGDFYWHRLHHSTTCRLVGHKWRKSLLTTGDICDRCMTSGARRV